MTKSTHTQVLLLASSQPITLHPKESHSLAGQSCTPLWGSPELMVWPGPLPAIQLVYWLFPSPPLPTSNKTPSFLPYHSFLRPRCFKRCLLRQTHPEQTWRLPALFGFTSRCTFVILPSLTMISFLRTIYTDPQVQRRITAYLLLCVSEGNEKIHVCTLEQKAILES